MGMEFSPTWLRQVSPHPRLYETTLTTAIFGGKEGIRAGFCI